ncbi:MAG: guanylyltransferase [Methanobacterium sp.]|nr:guanylyltransferase [Methanobacterium sp.]
MKECEIFSNLRVPCGSKIVIRCDGRNFSRLASNLKLEKPYDLDFVKAMITSCHEFFQEFSPSFIYTFSDEVNILLDDIPFNGRLEKINSVFSSFISGALTRQILLDKRFSNSIEGSETFKSISFDSRIIPLNSEGLVAYFKDRQDEAWRNCLNGYAYWILRQKYSKNEATQILDKKKTPEIHELLYGRNVNITEVPAWQRRGVGIYRKIIKVAGYNPLKKEEVTTTRRRPFTNWDLPLFDDEFFRKILKNNQ